MFRLSSARGGTGHEQAGARFAVVVQGDDMLGLSTVLVAPTSTRARAATFRPVIELESVQTCVLVEQTTAVDARRLGRSAGRLSAIEMQAVDEALLLMLGQ